tara:strand:+ start:287 stop:700 length:414 start_codon:yes stop_codon:yes gene_type:complete
MITFCMTCIDCNKEFPLTHFNKKLGERCKQCLSKRRSNVYEKYQAILRRFKTSKGCKQCGWKEHFAGLQFNHRDPTKKKFQIANKGQAILAKRGCPSWLNFRKELGKCDVLCSRCHSILTWEEGHQKGAKVEREHNI